MAKKRKMNKTKKSLLFSSLLMSAVILLLTIILSLIGFGGQKTAIVNGSLETSLVTVKNFFSGSGIRYFFNNAVENFSSFKPLILLHNDKNRSVLSSKDISAPFS